MKILVADDDRISRRIMQNMLQASGYEVITVGDGRAAADQLCSADGPRLALIDWMMPLQDGPAVCREVRERSDGAYTYIVLLTAKESSEDIVAGLEAGADDYLTKPCCAAELKARLLTGRRILQLEDRLVEAREAMRYEATHDALTSIWNRGAIMSLLNSELSRASRNNKPTSILLCDVDHFKRVNDVHGHTAGDKVLQELASRLQRGVRQYDSVGRYGGEEFLLILSDCNAEQVRARSEHLRTTIANERFRTQDGELSVTISLGAVTISGGIQTHSIESFLNQADASLYLAKSEGRNRVICGEYYVPA